MTADRIADRLAALRERIDRAATAAGRDPGGVRMLLATKTVGPDRIIEALAAGATLIGENRVQEVLAKSDELAAHPHESHFIGHLQSNKIGSLLGRISCLQTLDTPELARRLDERLVAAGRTLQVMVQVNVSGEASKSGVPPAGAPALVQTVAGLAQLRLRGFMTIGLNSDDRVAVGRGYAVLRELRDELTAGDAEAGATELSMGMSGDFEIAVAEGATIVRLGSAVFGSRTPIARAARA